MVVVGKEFSVSKGVGEFMDACLNGGNVGHNLESNFSGSFEHSGNDAQCMVLGAV